LSNLGFIVEKDDRNKGGAGKRKKRKKRKPQIDIKT
jgi:hypothetical protein